MARVLLTWLALRCAAALQVYEKPLPNDTARAARWLVNQASWGVLVTRSLQAGGVAFGNPVSIVDGIGGGTPFFYLPAGDVSSRELQADPRCTLTLSEASIDCNTLGHDPMDPQCARLSLTGSMVAVVDEDEMAQAKSALFERHPAMRSMFFQDWHLSKLQIQEVWLQNFYGPPHDLPPAEYFSAEPPSDVTRVNASWTLLDPKPPPWQKVKTARWLVHESQWVTLATTSIHLQGAPFGNIISVADGGSGIPYFYISALDTSVQDLELDPRCTLTFSENSLDCPGALLDTEDPRCAQLALSGTMARVTDTSELEFAEEALFAAHPVMNHWPASHGFFFAKLETTHILLADASSGDTQIDVGEYFAESTA